MSHRISSLRRFSPYLTMVFRAILPVSRKSLIPAGFDTSDMSCIARPARRQPRRCLATPLVITVVLGFFLLGLAIPAVSAPDAPDT